MSSTGLQILRASETEEGAPIVWKNVEIRSLIRSFEVPSCGGNVRKVRWLSEAEMVEKVSAIKNRVKRIFFIDL